MDFIKKTLDNSKDNFEKSFSKAEDKVSSSIGSNIPSLKPPSPLESVEKSASNLESETKTMMENTSMSSNPISRFFQTNWLSILFWIGIVLLVAFLGFNLFEYLGKMVDSTNKVLDPIISKLGNLTADTSKQAINVTSDGTKGLIDVAQKTTTGGIDLLQKQINKSKDLNNDQDPDPSPSNETDVKDSENDSNSSNSSNSSKNLDIDNSNNDITTTTSTSTQPTESVPDVVEVGDPNPYLAESNVQSNTVSGKTGKSGYCYIGTDNGIRTCAPVGKNNECMSGDIFPTNEICVNPDLRY